MKKYLSLLLGIVLMGTTMTSCLKSDSGSSDYKTNQVVNLCYLQCQSLDGSQSFINTKCSFTIEFNYTKNTVSITISNLKDFTNNYPNVTLKDMPFTMDKDGMRVARQTVWKGSVDGYSVLPEFSNISFQFADRVFQDSYYSGYIPVMSFDFTLNDECMMSFVPTQLYYFGPSTSTNSKGEIERSARSWYRLLLDPDKRTASVVAYGLVVAATEPKYENMILREVPYQYNMYTKMVTIDSDQTYKPVYQNPNSTTLTDYNGYEVSQVRVVAPILSSASLSFDCTVTKDNSVEKYSVYSNPGLPAVLGQ